MENNPGYLLWIVYLVFAIINLEATPNEQTEENCGSLLWDFVMVMIFFFPTRAFVKPDYSDDDSWTIDVVIRVISILATIGLASWGSYEVWGRSCTDVENNCTCHLPKNLHTQAMVVVIYQLVIIGIYLLVCVGVLGKIALTKDEPDEIENPRNIEITENDITNNV